MRPFAFVLALVLWPAATAAEQAKPTAPKRPPNAPAPARPVATPAPAPPSPPPGPESLVGQASPLCDAAFAETASSVGGRVLGPALLLYKGASEPWRYVNRDEFARVRATAPDEVKVLVCIEAKVQGVGRTYTDGSAALGTNWAVRLVGFPEGRPMGEVSFFGYPPSVKKTGGPGVGAAPVDELAGWLEQTIAMRGVMTGRPISGFALTPEGDGAFVFQAWELGDRPVALWNLVGAERVLTLPHTAASAAVSAKGGVLATGGVDKTVRLWNLASRTELRQLTGHAGFVRPVAFSPDGSLLASVSGDGLRLWDVASGRQVWKKSREELIVEAVAFTPDGAGIVLAGGSGAALWDLKKRRPLRTFPGPAEMASLSADGRTLATAGKNQLRVFDTQTGTPGRTFELMMIKDVALSPDGRALAAVSWQPYERTLVVWDVESGQELRRFPVPDTNALSFSRDGTRLLFGGGDGVIRTFDLGR